jgi:hypothetical protein
MVDHDQLWSQSGLHEFQLVRCVVTGHRDRFGVEVDVIEPVVGVAAFIDFVLLDEAGVQVDPADFPAVGSALDAVTLNFMPWGELRLSARPSSVARRREQTGQ